MLAAAAACLAVAGCGVVPPQGWGGASPSVAGPSSSPTPTPTPVTLTVDSGKVALRLRHVPSPTGNELARIPSGSAIIVDCVVKGASVTGSQGTTDRWGHAAFQGKSGYVSAAYLSGPSGTLPDCPVVPEIATKPKPLPTASGGSVGATVVAIARSQLGVAERGTNCNPYSTTCEEWCAHFAAWVWQKAGIKIPDRAFTGDLYVWGGDNKRSHAGTDGVAPGDLVFYGTAPRNPKTSTHVDVVVEVLPDRLRVVGGNVSDQVLERDVPRTGIYGYLRAAR